MTRVRVDGTGGGRVPVQVRRLVALEVTDRDAEVIVQGLQDAADMADDARGEVYAELAATIQHRTRARLRVDPPPRVQARPPDRRWAIQRPYATAFTAVALAPVPIVAALATHDAPAAVFLPAWFLALGGGLEVCRQWLKAILVGDGRT